MTSPLGTWIVLAAVCAIALSASAGPAFGAERPPSTAPGAASAPTRPTIAVVPAKGPAWKADQQPLHSVADLAVGEEQELALPDGTKAKLRLEGVEAKKDDLRQAVRQATVRLQVNGQPAAIGCSMYNLPTAVGGVQVDCTVVGEMNSNARGNAWAMGKAARIRVWPAGAAWIDANTFAYPVRQRWFAGPTQMANEPTYVDGVESPQAKSVYYHYGLDFGGAEGLIDILSATDGLVVSAGNARLEGYEKAPIGPRYDTVNVVDRRGWFHRYSHLMAIDPSVKVGEPVKLGQKIGTLGKEGDSGGWSHLHYQINSLQPSGRAGIEEGYAFLWEAYRREHSPKIIAVARPHVFMSAGSTVELDGGKSWSAAGKIAKYEWTFTDGGKAEGAKVSRKYDKVGQTCEILRVTDAAGNVDYDFAIVQIADKDKPKELPPGIHLAYAPTTGLKAGQAITFKVRSFGTTAGEESVDFGDGTPAAKVKSDGGVEDLAKDGYAIFSHTFAKAGQYVVTARRTNERGQEGVTRVLVVVE